MSLALYPTEEHQFLHVVNSIDCSKGGTALTYVTNSIVTKFAERLQKSYKKVTNSMVKNRIGIVMVLKDISDLKFAGGQTKEEIKNLYTEMSLPSLNYIEISEKLFKAPKIKDPIIELVKILAELEKRTANSGLKAEKAEVFNPKLLKATKKSIFTMIAEGDSAVDGLPQVFGREYISYMPLSGKLLNCIKSTPATLKKNARVMDIINAVGLGLEETKSEGIIIAVDKDTDGIGHIKSLIISLIYTVHPQMLKDGKVFYLDTPIMSITDKNDKLIKWYSTLEDYTADFDNIPKNTNHNYNKGLGSTTPEDFKLIKDTDGFESMLVQIEYDEVLHEQTILNWMADETVDIRKDMLATESFYINDI
jgi:DNA gyrase/topoisomerase IV subunit B